MEITFILKGDFEALPPMLPRLIEISQMGIKCNLICTRMKKSTRDLLDNVNVKCRETLHRESFIGKPNRIFDWLGFKRACKKIMKRDFPDSDMLYVCSADTALCLNSFLRNYEYVLQSNELYDTLPMYRNGIKKYARNAKAFVVPEICRANICMHWYDLKKKPYVIPNIPYVLSCEKNQNISDSVAKQIIDEISDKKILIYQGHIDSKDRSLSVIAEALKKINNNEYVLLVMGRNHNGSYEKLKEIYSGVYYIPFIPAPYHLEVTSHAYIALLSYDRVSMNNLFCAPNKIFEYSSLGVPMLGNDIPGLIYTISYEKMGKCASYNDVDMVADAIKEIEENYNYFSENAKQFFEKNDLKEMVRSLIDDL